MKKPSVSAEHGSAIPADLAQILKIMKEAGVSQFTLGDLSVTFEKVPPKVMDFTDIMPARTPDQIQKEDEELLYHSAG